MILDAKDRQYNRKTETQIDGTDVEVFTRTHLMQQRAYENLRDALRTGGYYLLRLCRSEA